MFSSKAVIKSPVDYQSFLGTLFHQEEPGKGHSETEENEFTPLYETEQSSLPVDNSESFEETSEEKLENETDAKAEEASKVYADALVQESIERAEKLLEVSRKEAEKIREDAWQKGYEEGLRQGREDGRISGREAAQREWKQDLDQFYKDCALTLGSIEELKKQSLSRYLDELKDISITVAEKIIHVSLRSSGEVIRKMILQEAEKLKKTSWLKIYIDKAEYEMLLETDSDVAAELSGVSRSIRFVISEKSDLGKLIMETPDEIVDLSIGTQMENLRTKLLQLPPREEH